jgi:hypothetical protein
MTQLKRVDPLARPVTGWTAFLRALVVTVGLPSGGAPVLAVDASRAARRAVSVPLQPPPSVRRPPRCRIRDIVTVG